MSLNEPLHLKKLREVVSAPFVHLRNRAAMDQVIRVVVSCNTKGSNRLLMEGFGRRTSAIITVNHEDGMHLVVSQVGVDLR